MGHRLLIYEAYFRNFFLLIVLLLLIRTKKQYKAANIISSKDLLVPHC
jgi:hypothetical protein